MGTKLYVGNLSYDTTENDLFDAFGKCGSVADVQLIQDRATGRSRGFAFVTMADDAAAEAAISKMHGSQFSGRTLTVNEAREREPRAGGGGGGGFGGGGGGGGGYGGGGGGGSRGGGGGRERSGGGRRGGGGGGYGGGGGGRGRY